MRIVAFFRRLIVGRKWVEKKVRKKVGREQKKTKNLDLRYFIHFFLYIFVYWVQVCNVWSRHLLFARNFASWVWCKYARLSQGLIFDNGIAAQKGCGRKSIWCNFTSKEESKAASHFWAAEVRVEYNNRKKPSGYENRIKDRA